MSDRILVVEDEANIAETIKIAIENESYACDWAASGEAALEHLAHEVVCLVVLDVGLPDMSGFELLKRIRQTHNIPVIFLTARGEEIDRVVGLEIGADDYITKPFSPRELMARIKAVLRRTNNNSQTKSVSESNTFEINDQQAKISFQQQPLELTLAEYKLLSGMLSQPNRVFTRAQLLEVIWDANHPSEERTIDTHIKSLRAKLKAIDASADQINTHRGIGYSISA